MLALEEILRITVEAYEKNDTALAGTVEPLEQVIDMLSESRECVHIARLRTASVPLAGFHPLGIFWPISSAYPDHCSNVAVCILELAHDDYSTHAYLSSVKSGSNKQFAELFDSYAKQFSLKEP